MADLTSFFNPSSVAIVGASSVPGKVGNYIVKNIISSEFPGEVYPINPKSETIEGLQCYKSLTAIGKPVDIAVISIPAKYCINVVEEAGILGIKNLVIVTAGFKEVGKAGLELERKLVEVANKYNINVIGPNGIGIIDTILPLNASFSAVFPNKGDIAFISQSGAMLVSIMDWSITAGMGFSRVISLGNKAQLNEIDFIEAIADDPHTKVIIAYIEDISDGERFIEMAKKATKKKPVIILKSGTSQAGAAAASSHTGALAGSDVAYETSFEQAGVIRAHSMTELFDLAICFSNQPVPKGNRIAVITNAGGPGIVATDAIENTGLKMARFSKETIEELRTSLPAESNIYNPVDVLGDAPAERYKLALEKTLSEDQVDAAIVLICPTAVTEPVSIAETIVAAHQKFPEKPILTSFMGGPIMDKGGDIVKAAGIPNFIFPEPAVSSLRGMSHYAQVKNNSLEKENEFDFSNVDSTKVKAVFYDVFRDGRRVLLGSEACSVAEAYGISSAPIRLATSAEQAAELANEMGYPVVIKVASPKILHKTDVGGVIVGLENADEVKEGYLKIMESVQRYLPDVVPHGIEVQKMMPKGRELIIGMTKDVNFGPMIAFGLGGIYVNLIKDVSFRLAKGLNEKEINEMISETKAYTLLKGYRGDKPADLRAVLEVIGRVSKLVCDFPEITEIDINPVFAYESGLSALDIKITIS